jgi:hypothetical protein
LSLSAKEITVLERSWIRINSNTINNNITRRYFQIQIPSRS